MDAQKETQTETLTPIAPMQANDILMTRYNLHLSMDVRVKREGEDIPDEHQKLLCNPETLKTIALLCGFSLKKVVLSEEETKEEWEGYRLVRLDPGTCAEHCDRTPPPEKL